MNMPRTTKMHKKHAGHPQKASAQSPTVRFLAVIRSSAQGVACSIGVALLLLLFAAFLIARSEDPVCWLYPTALTILYITAIVCGAIIMRFRHDASCLCGFVSGCMLLLVCMLLGCIVSDYPAASHPGALLTRVPIPLLSLLGATLGKKHPRRRTHRKH